MFPPQISDIDNAKYISSIGLMKSCDHNGVIEYIDPFKININWEKLLLTGKENSCIYVKMGNVREFITNIFDKIQFNFILITGDGDETFPYDIMNEREFYNIINN
jgi:hypothetical protein